MGWAWRSHAAAEGRVAFGRAGIQRGILNRGNSFLKALLGGQELTPEIRGRRDAISTDKNCEFRARVRLTVFGVCLSLVCKETQQQHSTAGFALELDLFRISKNKLACVREA